ncbi:uncharacterized protein [Amphiura filiformis]|uniref:uncharacterized protein n=1 Tax=Amphiura filiformis TaxID=82378 RepID=UPI003B21E7A1
MTSTRKKVGEHGATLELQKIKAKLEIPPGAIKPSNGQTPVITTMSMYLKGGDHPLLDDRLMMTPIITCGPNGTEFNEPVTLHLPHSCVDTNDIQLWSKPEIGTEGEWEKLPSTYTAGSNAAGWLWKITSEHVIIKVIRARSFTVTTSGDQERRMLMFMRPNPKRPSSRNVYITAYAVQEHWVDVIKTQRKEKEDNSVLCAGPTPFLIESSSASKGLEIKITETSPESGWTGKQVGKISYKKLQKDGDISQCQFSFTKCGEHIDDLRGKYDVMQGSKDLIKDYNFGIDMLCEHDKLKNMTSTRKEVGEHGATLKLQKIKAKLEIPPGAIKPSNGQTPVITTMSMYLKGGDHPLLDDRLMMTPIITCGPNGTEFNEPVTLHLPHSCVDTNDIQLWSKPEIGTEDG